MFEGGKKIKKGAQKKEEKWPKSEKRMIQLKNLFDVKKI
jgi:hypothetical protein